MVRNPADLRNLAVCGHGSAGKTTLVDALLVKSGAVNAHPSVDAGTSICDFDEEERQHHHSIEATVAHVDTAGKRINLIDTPGYPELVGQMIGALRATETALIVVDAHAGVKVNTRRAWQEAIHAGCGRMVVLTKLDTDNIDLAELMQSLRNAFGPTCHLINVPVGLGADLQQVVSTLHPESADPAAVLEVQPLHEALIETLVEADEAAMEQYFEGTLPDAERLSGLFVQAVTEGRLTPVFCVSTKLDVGVDQLLDALAKFAPSPLSIERVATAEDGSTITLHPDPTALLAAQVFKTRIDPFVQKLSFLRVFSGTFKKEATLYPHGNDDSHGNGNGAANGNGGSTSNGNGSHLKKGLKIAQLLEVQAGETQPVDEVGPGDIVAIAKCEELHTGESLGEATLPPLDFPQPMISLAIEPKSRGDEAKLSGALHKVAEEDATIHLEHDPETKEMVLTGMSELHLSLVQERLNRRDHVEIETHVPKIPYRETILTSAEGSYRHKKQSGGAGQFAEVHIRMFPLSEGTTPEEFATKARFPHMRHTHYLEKNHFLWIDSVVGGSIPANFMPAIEKGFHERVKQGVIAGCPVRDVCVEVHYGKDHPVDSNETAFKAAASKAFAEVFRQAQPTLLEPVVLLQVLVPTDKVGDISSDLAGRRGQMAGMQQEPDGMTIVEAEAPLAEVSTYARTLSSITGGQGSFTMELAHYAHLPSHLQQQVIAQSAQDNEH